MTVALGKALRLKIESATPGVYTTIANSRTDKFTINNKPIDVTDKDGMPWQKMIDGGVRSMSLDSTGIFTDAAVLATLLANMMNGPAVFNMQVVDGLGNKWQGPFHLDSIDKSGDYSKEDVYSIKLSSADTIVFTPHP